MKTLCALVTSLLCLPLAHADASTDLFQSKVDSMNYFIGNWSCTASSATSTNRVGGNREDGKAVNATVEKKVGDSWMVFRWDAVGGDTSNFASGVSYVSFDSMRNLFVDFTFAPRGGYASFTSDGWQDLNAIRWSGSAQNYQGQSVAQNKTITVLEKDLFSMTFETSLNGTSYDVVSRKICHRVL